MKKALLFLSVFGLLVMAESHAQWWGDQYVEQQNIYNDPGYAAYRGAQHSGCYSGPCVLTGYASGAHQQVAYQYGQSLNPAIVQGAVIDAAMIVGGELAFVGLGKVASPLIGKIAPHFFPSYGMDPAIKAMLRDVFPGSQQRQALKAWRHFHLEGKGWETYSGEMVDLFRTQRPKYETMFAPSAREAGLEGTMTAARHFMQEGSHYTPLFGEGRWAFVSTGRNREMAMLYHQGEHVVEETAGHIWRFGEYPNMDLWHLRVPRSLTLGPRTSGVGAVGEYPVLHEVTGGMVVRKEVISSYTEVLDLIQKNPRIPLVEWGEPSRAFLNRGQMGLLMGGGASSCIGIACGKK